MKLFISNTTKQNCQFRYRVEPGAQVITKNIAIGKQECLEQDLTTEQIDFILSQHVGVKYAYMVAEKDIDLYPGFIGLVYKIGSPVNAEKTASIIQENDVELDAQSAKLREDTMSVIAANLESNGASSEGLASEIVEEVPRGSDRGGLNEQISVEPKGKRGRPAKS